MYLPFLLNALVVAVFISSLHPTFGKPSHHAVSLAHSSPSKPLKRVVHPSTLSLEIIPRQSSSSSSKRAFDSDPRTLRHDDSFRLVISAFNETFYLHLRPNDHLIHPAARITYFTSSTDGSSTQKHTIPLLRESVKAYMGEVIAADHTQTRLREDAARVVHQPHHADLGFARIMVHDHGSPDEGIPPQYEGAFSVHGVIYHIMTKDSYLRRKHPLDPGVVQPLDDVDSGLVIWRESDIMTPEEEYATVSGESSYPIHEWSQLQSCGHDRLRYNIPSENPAMRDSFQTANWWLEALSFFGNASLSRRDDVAGGGMGTNFADRIGDTKGCPSTQKVVYMGVAADCEYVAKQGSQDDARKNILNNWNTASGLYKSTFNISLGIVELQVQSANCPAQPDSNIPWNIPCSSADLNRRLSLFSQWRGNKGQDGAGLWHLMSGCPTGSEVGIAWLATLCETTAVSNGDQVVSGTAVSTFGRTEWQVVAHETGHNFGAICSGDCTSTTTCCPLSTSTCNANSQFLMSPVAQSSEKVFSQCTLGNICALHLNLSPLTILNFMINVLGSLLGGGGKLKTTCVTDPDPKRQVVSLQMCGNGIVEPGEDCDPGLGMQSNCCDATTCKFKSGARCDPASSPCCTPQCSFAPSTQVCRPSKDSKCDMAELCTGNSSACPSDQFAPNGQSCGDNDLQCAAGLCTSPSLQCNQIGGAMGYTEACPSRGDKSCQVSCKDPTRANTCVLLGALLVDGSPCGYGGTCSNGTCQAGSVLDTIKSWYTQNMQIAIPVTIVAGLAVLLLLWCLVRAIMRCCVGKRRSHPVVADPHHHERLTSYDNIYQQPAMRSVPLSPRTGAHYSRVPETYDHSRSLSQGYNNRSNWVDDTRYNGHRGWS
ncbi:hypothetical protein AMATHDRAFT_75419 [Amanita thiersii Skay4041]|uniref:Disintegrin and metalloproteinase domain-containing protein B n=1 Tax=Amanita thiersii Skay4041 TaxID=703135 RepID=A0A2A9NSQ0_9AGAR|nr:hypothetical protein AMATHDRAFT_75419 [Amanita thiersii Skay4041]